jgi:hypothetical protein
LSLPSREGKVLIVFLCEFFLYHLVEILYYRKRQGISLSLDGRGKERVNYLSIFLKKLNCYKNKSKI